MAVQEDRVTIGGGNQDTEDEYEQMVDKTRSCCACWGNDIDNERSKCESCYE